MLSVKMQKAIGHSASKYFIVGLLAFSSDYIILLFTYYALNLPLKLATSLGFFSGFIISFSVNRQWVFGGRHKKHLARQVIEYLLLLVFNYLFTLFGVSFLNNHGVKPFIGKLLIMSVIMCWNYALFRWIIFSHAHDDE